MPTGAYPDVRQGRAGHREAAFDHASRRPSRGRRPTVPSSPPTAGRSDREFNAIVRDDTGRSRRTLRAARRASRRCSTPGHPARDRLSRTTRSPPTSAPRSTSRRWSSATWATIATGVAFTRDPATGEKHLFGEYLANAQGEDVVAGVRTPLPRSKRWRTTGCWPRPTKSSSESPQPAGAPLHRRPRPGRWRSPPSGASRRWPGRA